MQMFDRTSPANITLRRNTSRRLSFTELTRNENLPRRQPPKKSPVSVDKLYKACLITNAESVKKQSLIDSLQRENNKLRTNVEILEKDRQKLNRANATLTTKCEVLFAEKEKIADELKVSNQTIKEKDDLLKFRNIEIEQLKKAATVQTLIGTPIKREPEEVPTISNIITAVKNSEAGDRIAKKNKKERATKEHKKAKPKKQKITENPKVPVPETPRRSKRTAIKTPSKFDDYVLMK